MVIIYKTRNMTGGGHHLVFSCNQQVQFTVSERRYHATEVLVCLCLLIIEIEVHPNPMFVVYAASLRCSLFSGQINFAPYSKMSSFVA